MREIWKPVVGYEGIYEVSNLGRVRSLDRRDHRGQFRKGKVLSACDIGKGYLAVGLCLHGKSKARTVHRLVMEAFVGPCPDGQEVCHNDGDPSNNKLENLRYDTRKGNTADRWKHGTMTCAKLSETDVLEIMARLDTATQTEIAKDFGVHTTTIHDIARGRKWSHLTGTKRRDVRKNLPLTEEDVLEIIGRLDTETKTNIAEDFNVDYLVIDGIARGLTWSYLTGIQSYRL